MHLNNKHTSIQCWVNIDEPVEIRKINKVIKLIIEYSKKNPEILGGLSFEGMQPNTVTANVFQLSPCMGRDLDYRKVPMVRKQLFENITVKENKSYLCSRFHFFFHLVTIDSLPPKPCGMSNTSSSPMYFSIFCITVTSPTYFDWNQVEKNIHYTVLLLQKYVL